MNRVHGKVPIGGMPGQRRHEGVDAAETFVVHPPSHSSVTLMHVHDAAQIGEHGRCLGGIAFHIHASVRAECTQPLSNGGDGCCPWLRHGHLGVLAGRKDGPGSCWFSGGDQRPQVDVLVGPDGGLDFGVQCSPQDQEGSHGRLTLRGPELRRSRHLLQGAGQQRLEISALGIEC